MSLNLFFLQDNPEFIFSTVYQRPFTKFSRKFRQIEIEITGRLEFILIFISELFQFASEAFNFHSLTESHFGETRLVYKRPWPICYLEKKRPWMIKTVLVASVYRTSQNNA